MFVLEQYVVRNEIIKTTQKLQILLSKWGKNLTKYSHGKKGHNRHIRFSNIVCHTVCYKVSFKVIICQHLFSHFYSYINALAYISCTVRLFSLSKT